MPDEEFVEGVQQKYEPPKVLATYDAREILAEAETSSVVIVVG